MKYLHRIAVTWYRLLLPCLALCAASGQESLRYSVNWPSGLSLGEARMDSRSITSGRDEGSKREHRFTLEASIPGFAILDQYRSLVSNANCSIEFEKSIQHGARKTVERTTFKPEEKLATRQTHDGGKSSIPIPTCAKDGLAFLYWVRSELVQGRLPANQTILFGATYQISLQLAGQQDVQLSQGRVPADRLQAKVKGPASETAFELYFSRDSSRKLLLAKVPLVLGSFSLELVD